jgi:hypothetical protein
MKAWPELVSAAIAGKAEPDLLQEAAYASLRRLAGWRPPRPDALTVTPAPVDDLPLVSPGAAQRLSEMLAGTYQEVLPEWLDLAARANRRVPAHFLPDLFDYAKGHPGVRDRVDRVAGQRGRWLAEQNSSWAFGALEDAEDAYATGTRPARVSALQSLRQRDAAKARALLEDTWSKESGEDRAALIAALARELSPDDEPFLEKALKDRKRDVREAALDLLARLPNSALVNRMRERVTPLIKVKKSLLGSKVDVTPPEACDEAMVEDGIEPKPPQGTGEKAWWLSQMVALVPPSTWPSELAVLIAWSDWSHALLRGWSIAAARYRDQDWCEALLGRWLGAKAFDQQKMGVNLEALLRSLSPDRLERVVVKALHNSIDAGALLLWTSELWTPAMSLAFVENLDKLAHSAPSSYHAALNAPLRCDPDLLERVAAIAQRGANPFVTSVLDRVLPVMQYRAAMRKELSQ